MSQTTPESSGATDVPDVVPEAEYALKSFSDAIAYLSALATEILELSDQVKAGIDTTSNYQITTNIAHISRDFEPAIEEVLHNYHIAMGAIHRKSLGGKSQIEESERFIAGE